MTAPICSALVAATAVTGFLATTTAVYAAAPMVKKSATGYFRMMLGDFEVTALSFHFHFNRIGRCTS